jgi:zinc protease
VNCNFPWWATPFSVGGPDLFGISVWRRPEVSADAALSALDRVLTQLASGALAPDLLATAQSRVQLAWARELETLESRAMVLSEYAALVGDPSGLRGDFVALMSISTRDIHDAIHETLLSQPRAIVDARSGGRATTAGH